MELKLYFAKNLRADGTLVTLDIKGVGTLTVDFSKWDHLVKLIGGEHNIAKAKLMGPNTLEFPNDTHVDIEDFITLAKQLKIPR